MSGNSGEVYHYNIGYYTHEERVYTALYSSQKYTKEELSELISDVFAVVSEMSGYNLNEYDLSRNGVLHKSRKGYTVQDLYPSVIRYLIDNHQFNRLEYSENYQVFGWASVETDDWNEFNSKKLELIRKKIKEKEGNKNNDQ